MGDMIVDPAKMLLTLVGGLTQPIFQNGRLRADHKIAQSQQQQAQIAFGDALLRAGCEVADALSECRAAEQKATLRKAQSDAAQKAFENSLLLMQHSQSVGYLEALTANRRGSTRSCKPPPTACNGNRQKSISTMLCADKKRLATTAHKKNGKQ